MLAPIAKHLYTKILISINRIKRHKWVNQLMIRFEKITDDNYSECIKLDPGGKGRKCAAPNVNRTVTADSFVEEQ